MYMIFVLGILFFNIKKNTSGSKVQHLVLDCMLVLSYYGIGIWYNVVRFDIPSIGMVWYHIVVWY